MQCPECHVDMDPTKMAILIPEFDRGFSFKGGMI
jgi:hypothetical protein